MTEQIVLTHMQRAVLVAYLISEDSSGSVTNILAPVVPIGEAGSWLWHNAVRLELPRGPGYLLYSEFRRTRFLTRSGRAAAQAICDELDRTVPRDTSFDYKFDFWNKRRRTELLAAMREECVREFNAHMFQINQSQTAQHGDPGVSRG
jgi:hypothetical protein